MLGLFKPCLSYLSLVIPYFAFPVNPFEELIMDFVLHSSLVSMSLILKNLPGGSSFTFT